MKTTIQALRYSDWKGRMRAGLLWLACAAFLCFGCHAAIGRVRYAYVFHSNYYAYQAFVATWGRDVCGPTDEILHQLAISRFSAIRSVIIVAIPWLCCCRAWRALVALGICVAKPDTCGVICANHGNSLSEVMSRIRKEVVEFSAIFDPVTYEKVAEYTLLNTAQTNISKECFLQVRKLGGMIGLHNHPLRDCPFSSADFRAAIERRISTSIVVTAKTVYVLRLTDDLWELDDAEVAKYYDDTFNRLLEEPAAEPSSIRDIFAFCDRCLIQVCQETANHYGFEFTYAPFDEAIQQYR